MSKLIDKIDGLLMWGANLGGDSVTVTTDALRNILADVRELEKSEAHQKRLFTEGYPAHIRQAKREAYIEFREQAMSNPYTDIWDICADLLDTQEFDNE